MARQTEEGLPGSGGNSKLTGNPQPRSSERGLADEAFNCCMNELGAKEGVGNEVTINRTDWKGGRPPFLLQLA